MTVSFISCNKTTPAGFWKNDESNLLVRNISDQGSYGGRRAIFWKSENSLFDVKSILDFATENGWILIDSLEFDQNTTGKWKYDNKEIFPLSNTGFSIVAQNISTYNYFPRWFGWRVKLYKFKTGLITIEAGTDNSIEENGFILLNQNRSELAMYHLWGE